MTAHSTWEEARLSGPRCPAEVESCKRVVLVHLRTSARAADSVYFLRQKLFGPLLEARGHVHTGELRLRSFSGLSSSKLSVATSCLSHGTVGICRPYHLRLLRKCCTLRTTWIVD